MGSSGAFSFCDFMREAMISREAWIFAISSCTSDWQLHELSVSGERRGETSEVVATQAQL